MYAIASSFHVSYSTLANQGVVRVIEMSKMHEYAKLPALLQAFVTFLSIS